MHEEDPIFGASDIDVAHIDKAAKTNASGSSNRQDALPPTVSRPAAAAVGSTYGGSTSGSNEKVIADMLKLMQEQNNQLLQQREQLAVMQQFMLNQLQHQQGQPISVPSASLAPENSSSKGAGGPSKTLDPEVIKMMTKLTHKFADDMHKTAKVRRRIVTLKEEVDLLSDGKVPSSCKFSKPCQELHEMSLPWESSSKSDFQLSLKIPQGATSTDVIHTISLMSSLWIKQVCLDVLGMHLKTLEGKTSEKKFKETLSTLEADDALTKVEGLVDAKSLLYSTDKSVIDQKVNDCWIKCLAEVESRLQKEKQTKEKKEKKKTENENAALDVEPEVQLTALIKDIAIEAVTNNGGDVHMAGGNDINKTTDASKKLLESLRVGDSNNQQHTNNEKTKKVKQKKSGNETDGPSKGKSKDKIAFKGKGKGKGKGKSKTKSKGKGKGDSNAWLKGSYKGSYSQKNCLSPSDGWGHNSDYNRKYRYWPGKGGVKPKGGRSGGK